MTFENSQINQCDICTCLDRNKTIGDGGITVEFWIIKVHTSN